MTEKKRLSDYIHIKPDKVKSHIIIKAIAGLVLAALAILIGVNPFISLGGGALLFVCLHFRFIFGENFTTGMKLALLAVFSLVIFIIMQTEITAGLLIGPIKFIFNVLLIFGVVCFIWVLGGSIKIAVCFAAVLCTVFSVVDYVMVQARSFELQFSDMLSVGTGLAVASKYSFALGDLSYIGVMLMIGLVALVINATFPKASKDKKLFRTAAGLGATVAAALVVVVVYNGVFASVVGCVDKYWKFRGSENNGFFVNMIYSAAATKVKTPEDYNPKYLENEVSYFLAGTPEEKKTEKRPNVIVIMNETFSDVQNITEMTGNIMPVTESPTPFLDSLENSETLQRGYALASVYGGNTANSELELLTGFSMQFVPQNTVCYNLYINKNNADSIVNLYNNLGYKTVGMHPEDPTNWSRNKIYPFFGFDETYFMEDFDTGEEGDIFRDHVSDSCVYRKIEEIFENKGDEPLMLFAVTMQNHGGYSGHIPDFEYPVDITGYEKYTGIKEYLACIRNSDEALRGLIEYFNSVDEETIVLFFGDHQPSLSNIASKFYKLKDSSTTEQEQIKYYVPYLFSANFDISETKVRDFTSLNFLSSYLLEMCGMEKTPFLKTVAAIRETITALNANGYYDREMVWHDSTYKKPNHTPELALYSKLQYNVMFDKEYKIDSLFR